jgi:hypothetical protein
VSNWIILKFHTYLKFVIILYFKQIYGVYYVDRIDDHTIIWYSSFQLYSFNVYHRNYIWVALKISIVRYSLNNMDNHIKSEIKKNPYALISLQLINYIEYMYIICVYWWSIWPYEYFNWGVKCKLCKKICRNFWSMSWTYDMIIFPWWNVSWCSALVIEISSFIVITYRQANIMGTTTFAQTKFSYFMWLPQYTFFAWCI